ncbi:hypothetical protein TeGR_g3651 [Tetraparma gracilis]|uniref:CRAL-TRIO domain-containing protein n=1 Tax=Tetraparma gracilis TaxID=2962635 RepID=A0ABQ6MVE0_9STRA|nr:hypothetical protein TeGR_g3651 [Tetraparma gracilis]
MTSLIRTMSGIEVGGVPTSPITQNQSPPTPSELTQLSELRSLLSPTLSLPHIASHPECTSDWKLLRFLRGYHGVVPDAAAAFGRMAEFRLEQGVAEISNRMKSVEAESGTLPWPYDTDEFKPLLDCMGGKDCLMRSENTFDKNGNLVTSVAVGLYDLRKVNAASLGDLLVKGNICVDVYFDIVLHKLSESRGSLAQRHDLLTVLNPSIGIFQFSPAALRLINRVSANQKHYPESVGRITSCGNGALAVGIWKIIRPWVPKHTTEKIRVLGTAFEEQIMEDFDSKSQLFARYGGEIG